MALKPIVTSNAAPNKLRANASFMEAQTRRPEDVLALIEVTKEGYVPANVHLRSPLSTTMFTALIPAGQLNAVLADEGVTLVQPGSSVNPAASGEPG